ncbi:MAG: hypothetical protein JW996_01730, partial [Candidatus Cloacimonetes bacterium]|nr:hypothetical protein [Candidatus Cloacimonadota bacterium]
MPKNLKSLLVFITVLMLFSCTAEKDRQSSRTESSGDLVKEYKLSRYISSHVSGSITPEDIIRIKMVSPLVTADQVGQEETRVSYTFKPSIKGKLIWEDLYTLSFIPDSPLKSRSKYTGKFNIAGLIAERIELEPLNIEFFVVGRELNYYQADLKKASETRDLLQYEGEVGFNLKTGIEELLDGVKLYHGNKFLKLDWQQVDSSKNRFSFSSEFFLRSESEAGMKIIFNARKLDLEEDYERSFTLSSLHEMAVILIKKMADEKDPGFIIEFSDEIDPSFDPSAYIVIEPEVTRNIQVIGNKINVTGNFEYGKEYHLLIKQGIKNIYAQKSRSDFERIMPFSDLKPQIVFLHDGIFNPTDNKGKIRFRSLNVARVQLKVTRVFANNLCQFLQDVNLESSRKRTEFPVYQMTRVGLEIYSEELQVGEIYNQWLEHELDLSEVLKSDDQGLYVIHLSFQQKDILYRAPDKGNNWDYYYTDPRRSGYYYRNGTIHKPVIISDIGITCKKQNNSVKIFTNNVLTTSFISNCRIQLKSYQNQTLAEGWTNSQGFCEIALPDQEIFYIEAEKNGQRSIIKLNEMQWNYSTFDVGGVSGETGGIKAFIYTERGVYRPGDEINLNIIIRNEDNTFPDNHPISVIIKNPQRRQVLNETIKVADDGFYHLSFTTKPEDDTGNWEATVIAGNSRFFHELKIETVVAERLRIQIKPEEKRIRAEQGIFLADLQSSYLFGNPAAGLSARVTAEIFPYTRKWDKPIYRQFTFTDEAMDYQTRT